MKKFRFSLEAVRVVRERKEQTALEEYGRAVQEREKALEQLRGAEQRMQAHLNLIAAEARRGTKAGWLSLAHLFSAVLEEEKKKCAEKVHQFRAAADAAQQRLLCARQEREAVDKIRSKQLERHLFEAGQEYQKEMDDLSARRFLAARETGATNPA